MTTDLVLIAPIDIDDDPLSPNEISVMQADNTPDIPDPGVSKNAVKALSTTIRSGLAAIETSVQFVIDDTQIDTRYVDDLFSVAGVASQVDRAIPNEMAGDKKLKPFRERLNHAFDDVTIDVQHGLAEFTDTDVRTRTRGITLIGENFNDLSYLNTLSLKGEGRTVSKLNSELHYVVTNGELRIVLSDSALEFKIDINGHALGHGPLGTFDRLDVNGGYHAEVTAHLVFADGNADGFVTAQELAASHFEYTVRETLDAAYSVILPGLSDKIHWSSATEIAENGTMRSAMYLPELNQFVAAANHSVPSTLASFTNIKPISKPLNNKSGPGIDAVADAITFKGRVADSATKHLATSASNPNVSDADLSRFVLGTQVSLVHWSVDFDKELFHWEKTVPIASINIWVVGINLEGTIEGSLDVGIHASGWIGTTGLTVSPGSEIDLDGSAEIGLQGSATVLGFPVARVRGTVGVDLDLSVIVVNPYGNEDVNIGDIRMHPTTYLAGDFHVGLFVHIRAWVIEHKVLDKKWHLVNLIDKHFGAPAPTGKHVWANRVDSVFGTDRLDNTAAEEGDPATLLTNALMQEPEFDVYEAELVA